MSCGSVLLVRRAVSDVAVQNDERGTLFRLPESVQRVLDTIEVVGIADSQNVPSVCKESCSDILRECQTCVSLDRDVVVVVNPAKVIQAQVPRQRRRLRGHTFHEAAIAANGVNVVIEHLEAWPVEVIGKPLFRDRHADACGDSLSERSGRGFDAGHPVILGVTRRLAVELAEPADIIERHRRLPQRFIVRVHSSRTTQMERGPEQHRSMAVRQHEAVSIWPDRILRIKMQHSVPDCIDQRCECHRRTGVSRLGLLDCID